jgi:type I restriction enzyme S subunit
MTGDVIAGTMGSPNLRACMLPESVGIALNKADCVLIRPDREIVLPEYICWLLNMPSTLKLAQCLILGQTRLRISMGRLKTLVVPVPPLELQQKFARQIQQVEVLRQNMSDSQESLMELFQSSQMSAFAQSQPFVKIESGTLANV